ncbi:MAG: thioredoxin family protein [Pirellulales bacterium]|nr:thioredoxin family protein [Pirellulales bacterium]
MVKTASTMLELGTVAPDFTLPDAAGRMVPLDTFDGAPALLVIFMCNHCPYVKHVAEGLVALAKEYQARGVAVVGINSNDVETYPEDAPDRMLEEVQRLGYDFPYLYDETQEVAKAYRAACTPDFYVFDANRRLVYRGQMDGSRPGSNLPVTGEDLRAALDAVLEGRPMPTEQKPSLGCNIKWRAGNEPEYFR